MLVQLVLMAACAGTGSEELDSIVVWSKATPTSVQLGDAVFLKVVIQNNGDREVSLASVFRQEFGTLFLELADRVDTPAQRRFWFQEDAASGAAEKLPLKPGEQRVVYYGALAMPPLQHIDCWFWNPERWKPEEYTLLVSLRIGRSLFLRNTGPEIEIRRRPEKEMAALLDSYRAHMKGEREQDADWDWNRPLLCGVGRVPLEWSRPEKLASLEEMLSPGSLRDVVHLTRLAAKTYDSETVEEKRVAMGELLRWLDSRPEIERHYLAMRLESWCWHNKGLGEFGYELVDELIDRLPERYGADADYRQNARRQYLLDHPAAAEYWKQADKTR